MTSVEGISPRPETGEADTESPTKGTQDVPTEGTGLLKKISSLKEADKPFKTPFHSRTISCGLQIQELDEEDATPAYKQSCDLSLEFLEESALLMPRQPTVFKASMKYIKLTTNPRNV